MRRPWIILPLVLLLPLSLLAAQPRKPPSEPRLPPEPSAPTWNEPDEFRGLKFGADLRRIIFECPSAPSPGGRKYYRSTATTQRCWELMFEPKGNEVDYWLRNFSSLGRVPLGQLWAKQTDHRLTFMHMTVDHDFFRDLQAILIEGYGQPTHDHTTEVQTKAGAKFTSRELQWVGKNIKIEFSERSGQVDQTTLGIFSLDWAAQQKRERDQQRRQGAEGLSR